MIQFIKGSEDAWTQLKLRATGQCIRYRQQAMPAGCQPSSADIGFEISQRTQTAKLLVQRGVRYDGGDRQVEKWFQVGERQFRNFDELRSWVLEKFSPVRQTLVGSINRSAIVRPTTVTDMDAVHAALENQGQTINIDEEKLLEQVKVKVIGQDEALKGLCGAVVRHTCKLHPERPAVVFAIGPTGVGKTRSAEVLAQQLTTMTGGALGYGFLRLDMSEFQEAHRVSQLLGSVPGYVGYGDGSQLLDALRGNQRLIILFDEIEKAHPAILKVLMNAMDAGRISGSARSSQSREIDCRKAIFVFTSNIDSTEILGELSRRGAGTFGDRDIVDEVCRRRIHASGIAPEIVGRISRFLVYKMLSPQVRAEIIAISIAEVAEEYGQRVSYIEPSVIVELLKRSNSHNFGARPERALIDEVLGSEFSKVARATPAKTIFVLGPPFRCETSNRDEDPSTPSEMTESSKAQARSQE
jgi:hypothetical protein